MAAKFTNNLPAFLAGKELAGAKAITMGTMLIATDASYLTPIDTSTLLNSQYRNVKKVGTKILGEIGYTAEYAGYVHDPNVKQRFRRDSAEKEFLLKGANRAKPKIDELIKKALKA